MNRYCTWCKEVTEQELDEEYDVYVCMKCGGDEAK
jgi:Zn finger protein HypA/HybF involved in hydrogenase expression